MQARGSRDLNPCFSVLVRHLRWEARVPVFLRALARILESPGDFAGDQRIASFVLRLYLLVRGVVALLDHVVAVAGRGAVVLAVHFLDGASVIRLLVLLLSMKLSLAYEQGQSVFSQALKSGLQVSPCQARHIVLSRAKPPGAGRDGGA